MQTGKYTSAKSKVRKDMDETGVEELDGPAVLLNLIKNLWDEL